MVYCLPSPGALDGCTSEKEPPQQTEHQDLKGKQNPAHPAQCFDVASQHLNFRANARNLSAYVRTQTFHVRLRRQLTGIGIRRDDGRCLRLRHGHRAGPF